MPKSANGTFLASPVRDESVGIEKDRKRLQIERIHKTRDRLARTTIFRDRDDMHPAPPGVPIQPVEGGQLYAAGGAPRRPEI
jgi:hypothetical protein